MPNVNFENPILNQANNTFTVTGPFVPAVSADLKLVGPVTIRFLIVQHLQGQAVPVVVDGTATWESPASAWVRVFSPAPAGLLAGKVRGIGVAVIRWDSDPPDPAIAPAFETFTWCIDKDILVV